MSVVLVVDYEKLENDIRNQLKDTRVQVIQLPKSGGVQTMKYEDKHYQLERY